MKKVLLVACMLVFAVAVFAGCNTEALKKLTEENITLTLEVATQKAKVADLEKAKADLQNQVALLNADLPGQVRRRGAARRRQGRKEGRQGRQEKGRQGHRKEGCRAEEGQEVACHGSEWSPCTATGAGVFFFYFGRNRSGSGTPPVAGPSRSAG